MVIVQRLRDFRVHSPKWDIYITPETPKEEEAEKLQEPDVVDDFKETVVFLDTKGQMHIGTPSGCGSTCRTCTSSNQKRSQHGGRDVDMKSYP